MVTIITRITIVLIMEMITMCDISTCPVTLGRALVATGARLGPMSKQVRFPSIETNWSPGRAFVMIRSKPAFRRIFDWFGVILGFANNFMFSCLCNHYGVIIVIIVFAITLWQFWDSQTILCFLVFAITLRLGQGGMAGVIRVKWWCHESCGDFRMDLEQKVELYCVTNVQVNVEYILHLP